MHSSLNQSGPPTKVRKNLDTTDRRLVTNGGPPKAVSSASTRQYFHDVDRVADHVGRAALVSLGL
jgi:hypothetical protein